MREDLDNLYLASEEPVKGTLLALRSIILGHDPHVSETVKYGMPCFLYRNNIMCYLWTDVKTGWPYILMAEGKLLDNPSLEAGSRRRMKILQIDPDADLPLDLIGKVLDEAIALYKDGKVKLK